MSGRASTRSRRRGERGVSWVTALLFLLAVGAGYLGYVWLPLFFDHYTVKQVVADYMNRAVKDHEDAQLVRDMVAKLHSLGQESTVDDAGRTIKVPKIEVDEGGVTWERDASTKALHVAFQYERQVVYPFLDRVDVTTFSIDRTYDISPPDWGPAR